MSIKMLVNSRYNGARVAAGEVVDYGKEINDQLISEGSAEGVADEAEGGVVNDVTITPKDENTSGQGEPTAEEKEAAALEAANAAALVKKALDNQYNKAELVEAAFKAGVEFPAEATKAVIIEAAVVQGKAEALLK